MSDSNDWGLSPKHTQFVRHYLTNGRNATDAYKRVYPKNKKPEVDASALLRNPKVSAVLAAEDAKIQDKFEITRERILKEMAMIAFSKPTDFIAWWGDENVSIPDSKDLSDWEKASIAGIEQGITEAGDRFIKTKFHDRSKALEKLYKLAGFKHGAGQEPDTGARTALLKRISDGLRKRKGRGGKA